MKKVLLSTLIFLLTFSVFALPTGAVGNGPASRYSRGYHDAGLNSVKLIVPEDLFRVG